MFAQRDAEAARQALEECRDALQRSEGVADAVKKECVDWRARLARVEAEAARAADEIAVAHEEHRVRHGRDAMHVQQLEADVAQLRQQVENLTPPYPTLCAPRSTAFGCVLCPLYPLTHGPSSNSVNPLP